VGWTTYNSGTLDDAIRQEFGWMQIVKQAPGRRVRWILAERDGHRSISAVLSERDGRGWSVKIVHESCGPNETDCPVEFLDGLPEPVGFAAEWRERVRARRTR
jgi:hypothetical protein